MEIMVSIGEILDKITILEIKKNKIIEESKLKNILFEYSKLSNLIQKEYPEILGITEYNNLYEINLKLWVVEDLIRDKERLKDFGDEFIELARSVYFLNDERAKIKKEINLKFKSAIVEEKSYKEY